MARVGTSAGLILLGVYAASGQDAAPRFEVASIKPSGAQSVRAPDGDPGMYRYSSATLQDLIEFAYNVQYFQISSLVPLDRDRFDVVVKVPQRATKHEFELMLQNLLAERFQLRLHVQSHDFPGYALVVAKSGTKLKAGVSIVPSKEGFPDLPPDRPGLAATHSMDGDYEVVRVRAVREPVSELAEMLEDQDLHVVDKTGLTGLYDFTLEYTLDPPDGVTLDAPPAVPDLSTALTHELGLELVDKKIPYDVLIVDHVETTPSGM